MNFTDRLHEAGKALWHKSMVHPFIKELQSGELPIATLNLSVAGSLLFKRIQQVA